MLGIPSYEYLPENNIFACGLSRVNFYVSENIPESITRLNYDLNHVLILT